MVRREIRGSTLGRLVVFAIITAETLDNIQQERDWWENSIAFVLPAARVSNGAIGKNPGQRQLGVMPTCYTRRPRLEETPALRG
jgi:hypothetical protein